MAELRRAYEHREQVPLDPNAEPGTGPVIGYLGADIPEELILAAGARPVRVSGRPMPSMPLADRYIGGEVDAVTRSQLERILDGTYGFLDFLVIAHDTEGLVRLFYTIRELRRVEPGVTLPPFHFFDLLHLPHRTTALYNRARTRELRQVLESWTDREITDADLHATIVRCNEHRRLLGRVLELRTASPPRLTGVEALRLIGSGMVLPKTAHAALLRALLELCAALPRYPDRVRVFLTGSAHEWPELYQLVEAHGALVVGEDHDWGDPWYEDLVDEDADPIDALADRYQYRAPSASRSSIAARAAYLERRAAACRAQAVIAFVRAGDEAPAWDFPRQRMALDRHGIPSLLVDRVPYGAAVPAAAQDAVAGFLMRLRPIQAEAATG
ncbi:MAG: 2-hydroxyacyl-CoA dehydratase [Chloroflexi bacterium]|nr:2-hydroxyacyl-CoA dehydratase [Chloroflexota bacterium]